MASAREKTAVARGTHEFQIIDYSVCKYHGSSANGSSSIKDVGFPFHDGGANNMIKINYAALHLRAAAMHGTYITRPPIKSGAFQVGGYTWDLVCAFQEKGQRHLEYITLELLGPDIASDVVATASLQIDDPLGRGPPAVWRSDAANPFSKRVHGTSWKLSLPDAFCGDEQRYVSHDDRLTILCTVEVFEEKAIATAAEPRKCFASTVPPPTIARDFHKLLHLQEKYPETSDVTFVVEDTEILAHRHVLAMRSPVFAAELLGHMRESSTGRVTIHDMTASTFRAMLLLMYSDEFPVKPNKIVKSRNRRSQLKEEYSMARDLLVVADRYDLERLRLMCENILVGSISITTVVPTLLLVRGRQSCHQLEDYSCIQYITSDPDVYAAMRETEEYKELKETCSSCIIEVNERLVAHYLARHTNSSPSSSSYGSLRRPLYQKSMSTFKLSKVARGTHEFRISNFSSVQMSLGPGQVITSDIFKVGRYDWTVNVYPSGYSMEGDEKAGAGESYISVYLCLWTDPGRTARVKSSKRFRIDDPSGESPSIVLGSEEIFTKVRESWGFQKFITVKCAKSRYLGQDGSLTIHCDIDVTKETYTASNSTATIASAPIIVVPPSNIASHLKQMMVSRQGSDVTFLVEESEIHALRENEGHVQQLARRTRYKRQRFELAGAGVASQLEGAQALLQ